jgi:hypothetical protein
MVKHQSLLVQVLLTTALVLLLRLPFLNEAVQGDDVYYLYGAQHAQIDPLHPLHTHYAFLGECRTLQYMIRGGEAPFEKIR